MKHVLKNRKVLLNKIMDYFKRYSRFIRIILFRIKRSYFLYILLCIVLNFHVDIVSASMSDIELINEDSLEQKDRNIFYDIILPTAIIGAGIIVAYYLWSEYAYYRGFNNPPESEDVSGIVEIPRKITYRDVPEEMKGLNQSYSYAEDNINRGASTPFHRIPQDNYFIKPNKPYFIEYEGSRFLNYDLIHSDLKKLYLEYPKNAIPLEGHNLFSPRELGFLEIHYATRFPIPKLERIYTYVALNINTDLGLEHIINYVNSIWREPYHVPWDYTQIQDIKLNHKISWPCTEQLMDWKFEEDTIKKYLNEMITEIEFKNSKSETIQNVSGKIFDYVGRIKLQNMGGISLFERSSDKSAFIKEICKQLNLKKNNEQNQIIIENIINKKLCNLESKRIKYQIVREILDEHISDTYNEYYVSRWHGVGMIRCTRIRTQCMFYPNNIKLNIGRKNFLWNFSYTKIPRGINHLKNMYLSDKFWGKRTLIKPERIAHIERCNSINNVLPNFIKNPSFYRRVISNLGPTNDLPIDIISKRYPRPGSTDWVGGDIHPDKWYFIKEMVEEIFSKIKINYDKEEVDPNDSSYQGPRTDL